MRIHFDGRIWQFQKAGGINRYFTEIIRHLPEDWEPIITGVDDFGINVPAHPKLKLENPPRFRPGRFREPYYRRFWRPRILRGVSIAHPTYYDLTSGFKLAEFKCPLVVTVHDMIYARFAHLIEGAREIIQAQRAAVLRADRVICISRATERDLLEFIPEAAGKTTIIYHGSSFPAVDNTPEEVIFRRPTFLFVGYRGGYKNFSFVLRAFAKAARENDSICLRIAGPPLTSDERWQIQLLGIGDKIESLVYPDEAALRDAYKTSVALLYPSRYEGFGIPPLEAMACGCIPVTANVTSLPEVVGDGGIQLDPTDESTWAETILKLSRPFSGRPALLQRGRQRLLNFSWQRCAHDHVTVYRQLI